MTKNLADLKWGHGRTGSKIGNIYLFPGDVLEIKEGWIVTGPADVTVVRRTINSKPEVYKKPLPKTIFDIDNPLEYPCLSCGAPRHAHCLGNNEDCTYRVFHIQGGVL